MVDPDSALPPSRPESAGTPVRNHPEPMSGLLRNRCTDSPGITVRFQPDYTGSGSECPAERASQPLIAIHLAPPLAAADSQGTTPDSAFGNVEGVWLVEAATLAQARDQRDRPDEQKERAERQHPGRDGAEDGR
jgi:hypothetical protein